MFASLTTTPSSVTSTPDQAHAQPTLKRALVLPSPDTDAHVKGARVAPCSGATATPTSLASPFSSAATNDDASGVAPLAAVDAAFTVEGAHCTGTEHPPKHPQKRPIADHAIGAAAGGGADTHQHIGEHVPLGALPLGQAESEANQLIEHVGTSLAAWLDGYTTALAQDVKNTLHPVLQQNYVEQAERILSNARALDRQRQWNDQARQALVASAQRMMNLVAVIQPTGGAVASAAAVLAGGGASGSAGGGGGTTRRVAGGIGAGVGAGVGGVEVQVAEVPPPPLPAFGAPLPPHAPPPSPAMSEVASGSHSDSPPPHVESKARHEQPCDDDGSENGKVANKEHPAKAAGNKGVADEIADDGPDDQELNGIGYISASGSSHVMPTVGLATQPWDDDDGLDDGDEVEDQHTAGLVDNKELADTNGLGSCAGTGGGGASLHHAVINAFMGGGGQIHSGRLHGGGLSGGAPSPRSRAPSVTLSVTSSMPPAVAPPLVATAANRPLGGGFRSGRKRHAE